MANVFVYSGIAIAAGALANCRAPNLAHISFLSEADNSVWCGKQTNTAQAANESAAIFNMV